MPVHHPGRPEDLPAPGELWARWAMAAVLTADPADEALGPMRSGWWADDGALRRDDGGTSWWALRRLDSGRFLLHGWDESGDVHGWEPPVDLFAGAPDVITSATAEKVTGPLEPGCAYWWDGDRWGRAPYPDELPDDGLDFGLGSVLDPEVLLSALGWETPELAAAVAELIGHALDGTVTAARLEAIAQLTTEAGAPPPDVPAMLRALTATGLATPKTPAR